VKASFPWGLAFIVLKVWGTVLASWSWWWILLSPIPVLWAVFKTFGLIQ
jgi:hypothetical protein